MTLAWQTVGPILVARAGATELAVQIIGGHPRFTIRKPAADGRAALVASGTAPTVADAMAAAERAHRPQIRTRVPLP